MDCLERNALASKLQTSAAMSGHALMLEDLVTKFQTASDSLERSYRELQGRVQSLTAELEREREERIRLERLAAMGEMAMELAHEIRNPLGSIELYASMMDGEYAEQIVRSVRLLNHSVTNVLHFGRPIAPVIERMSVNRLLEGIRAFLQPVAAQKQVRLDAVCDPNLNLSADYELLHRMLLNLVLNALRETSRDGTVRLNGRVAGRDIILEVEDDGPGIQDEKLGRLFDPLFSTSRDGCGLGLPIVKRIVQSHGGAIDVDSSAKGTRFVIRFAMEGGHPVNAGPTERTELIHNTEVVSEPVACS